MIYHLTGGKSRLKNEVFGKTILLKSTVVGCKTAYVN